LADPRDRLPEPTDDVLRPEMTPADVEFPGRRRLDSGRYRAFESGDRRFAWLPDPPGPDIDVGEPAFLQFTLARSGDGWTVLEVDGFLSPEDAEAAAARRWAEAEGLEPAGTQPVPDH
jgi:hypothetical protein